MVFGGKSETIAIWQSLKTVDWNRYAQLW